MTCAVRSPPATAARDQHVDAVVGLDEAGDARDVVDAHGRGAHAVGQQRRDRRALPFGGNLVWQDRLVDRDRHQRDALLARRASAAAALVKAPGGMLVLG